jgi:hypothetical protein
VACEFVPGTGEAGELREHARKEALWAPRARVFCMERGRAVAAEEPHEHRHRANEYEGRNEQGLHCVENYWASPEKVPGNAQGRRGIGFTLCP